MSDSTNLGPSRVHVSFVAIRSIKIWKDALLPIVFAGFGGIAGSDSAGDARGAVLLAGLALVFFLGIPAWAYFSWRRFTWELTATELHISSGVLVRKEAHIPVARIHSVDHSANIAERALGVVRLKVQTPGGGAEAEGVIEGMTLSAAEALQGAIFERMKRARATSTGSPDSSPGPLVDDGSGLVGGSGDLATEVARMSGTLRGAFAGERADIEPVEFEFHLTVRDLFLAGLSNNRGGYLFFILIAAAAQIVEFGNIGDRITAVAGSVTLLAGVALALLAAAATWAISVVTTALSFAGFVVRRRGSRIEIERGLLERHVVGISLDRIQSVRVKQGFIRRLFGYAEISLDTVMGISSEGEAGRTAVVHPFVKLDLVDGYLSDLLPSLESRPSPSRVLPMRALRRYVFLWAGYLALVLVPAGFIAEYFLGRGALIALAIVIVLALAAWGGILSFKARAFGLSSTVLSVRTGVLGREIVFVQRGRIQWARVAQSPFQRRLGLATFVAHTAAGGSAGPGIRMRDVTLEQANEMLEWAWPAAAHNASTDANVSVA